MSEIRTLSPDEERAIRSLKRLARSWPQTLKLFSWSGSLLIMDAEQPSSEKAVLDTVSGIPSDGGDPSHV